VRARVAHAPKRRDIIETDRGGGDGRVQASASCRSVKKKSRKITVSITASPWTQASTTHRRGLCVCACMCVGACVHTHAHVYTRASTPSCPLPSESHSLAVDPPAYRPPPSPSTAPPASCPLLPPFTAASRAAASALARSDGTRVAALAWSAESHTPPKPHHSIVML